MCNLNFGGVKPVSSVVLVVNGISFAVMTMLFTTIGSCADYGIWNKWILIVATGEPDVRTFHWLTPSNSELVICWASQFGWMGITHASQWQAAIAVYLLGYISYGVTLVFYSNIFPRLARNTAKTKKAREDLDKGDIAIEDYETVEMLERNRLSTISTAHSNCESRAQRNSGIDTVQGVTSSLWRSTSRSYCLWRMIRSLTNTL